MHLVFRYYYFYNNNNNYYSYYYYYYYYYYHYYGMTAQFLILTTLFFRYFAQLSKFEHNVHGRPLEQRLSGLHSTTTRRTNTCRLCPVGNSAQVYIQLPFTS